MWGSLRLALIMLFQCNGVCPPQTLTIHEPNRAKRGPLVTDHVLFLQVSKSRSQFSFIGITKSIPRYTFIDLVLGESTG